MHGNLTISPIHVYINRTNNRLMFKKKIREIDIS